jgi:hypothetical protein
MGAVERELAFFGYEWGTLDTDDVTTTKLELFICFDGYLETEVLFSYIDKCCFAMFANRCDSSCYLLYNLLIL